MFSFSQLLFIGAAYGLVQDVFASHVSKRAVSFFAPIAGGGSELDDAGSGVGEPMNVN